MNPTQGLNRRQFVAIEADQLQVREGDEFDLLEDGTFLVVA